MEVRWDIKNTLVALTWPSWGKALCWSRAAACLQRECVDNLVLSHTIIIETYEELTGDSWVPTVCQSCPVTLPPPSQSTKVRVSFEGSTSGARKNHHRESRVELWWHLPLLKQGLPHFSLTCIGHHKMLSGGDGPKQDGQKTVLKRITSMKLDERKQLLLQISQSSVRWYGLPEDFLSSTMMHYARKKQASSGCWRCGTSEALSSENAICSASGSGQVTCWDAEEWGSKSLWQSPHRFCVNYRGLDTVIKPDLSQIGDIPN